MTDLWKAQIDFWIKKLSEPGVHLSKAEGKDIKSLFSREQWERVRRHKVALIEEMSDLLEGCGQTEPSEKSEELLTLIRNIGYTQQNQRAEIERLEREMRKLESQLSERRSYITIAIEKARAFYEGMPSEEKKFWFPPEVDEDGDWESVPYRREAWSAVLPDIISPSHKAMIEGLERLKNS